MKTTIIKLQWIFAIALYFIFCVGSISAAPLELKSPNGELKISVYVKEKIFFNISFGQNEMLK